MDARQRWQALQARLKAARSAVDAGDRKRALAEIAAALELDKDFLAAHALRDRIESMTAEQWSEATTVAQAAPIVAAPAAAANAIRPPVATAYPISTILPPAVPPGYARFEQRARRRRVEKRVDAARAAIEQKRLRAAATALDEVIELDPNLPELAELTAQFDALRRSVAAPRRGPWVAAAAVFAIAVFGGTWRQTSQPVRSRPLLSAAPLPLPLTTMVAATEPSSTVATSGTVAREDAVPVSMPAPLDQPRLVNAIALPAPVTEQRPAISTPPLRLAAMPVEAPPPPVLMDAAIGPVSTPTALPVSMTIPPKVDAIDDSVLVKQALQRYRSAYEGLDAQSAQAVWPAVNEAALARAFEGLESQSLTFEACDVRLRGEAATATCRGSARYVTKVGSRDPRVEPRTWNFTLRKTGNDWKIDSARAQK